MKSQKEMIATYKAARVTVLSFTDGKRYSSYGPVDILTALKEVARKSAEGRQVLILDPEKDNSIGWEIRNRSRIPYEVCLPWVVTFGHPLFK